MNLKLEIKFLDEIIEFQRFAIRSHMVFGFSLLVLGLLIIFLSFFLPKNLLEEFHKTTLSIGGSFIASLSSFQLKEVIHRKETMNRCEIAKNGILNCESDDELKKIKEFCWRILLK